VEDGTLYVGIIALIFLVPQPESRLLAGISVFTLSVKCWL